VSTGSYGTRASGWLGTQLREKPRSRDGAAKKKVALIREVNPMWEDLAEGWGKQFALEQHAPGGEKQVPHG